MAPPRKLRPRSHLRLGVLITLMALPELAVLLDLVEPRIGLGGALLCFFVLQLPVLIELRGIGSHREATPVELLLWQSFYAFWLGAFIYALAAGALRVGLLAASADIGLAGDTPPAWVAALPFCIATYGVFIRQHWYPHRRIEVTLQSLPNAFDGLRVVQLSDIHVGKFIGRRRLRRIMARVRALSPDLLVITGDVLDTSATFAPMAAEALASVPCEHGTFVALGNHDHYSGAPALRQALSERGITVLVNEGVALRRGADILYLAGVDDLWHGADLGATLSQRPPNACVVLLSHQPDIFPAAAEAGVALVLAGHTHGGQIALPQLAPVLRNATPARLITAFTRGLYALGTSTLYVSQGTGVIRPLARLGAPPEITELVLRAPTRA